MAETQITDQTVLVALPAEEDRTSLATILAGSNWKVRFVRTFRDTQKALRALPGVVISEREFSAAVVGRTCFGKCRRWTLRRRSSWQTVWPMNASGWRC